MLSFCIKNIILMKAKNLKKPADIISLRIICYNINFVYSKKREIKVEFNFFTFFILTE